MSGPEQPLSSEINEGEGEDCHDFHQADVMGVIENVEEIIDNSDEIYNTITTADLRTRGSRKKLVASILSLVILFTSTIGAVVSIFSGESSSGCWCTPSLDSLSNANVSELQIANATSSLVI